MHSQSGNPEWAGALFERWDSRLEFSPHPEHLFTSERPERLIFNSGIMDDLDSLTVAELKQLLKEKGFQSPIRKQKASLHIVGMRRSQDVG